MKIVVVFRSTNIVTPTSLLKALALLLLGTAVCICTYLYLADDGAQASRPVLPERQDAQRPEARVAAAPAMPGSVALETRPRGDNRIFRVDGDGELVIDGDTPSKLDALIAGPPPLQTASEKKRLEEAVKEGLPANASARAVRILHQYIVYRAAEQEALLRPHNEDLAAAAQMLTRIVELRRQHFGTQVAEAMFRLQEAQARQGIEIVQVEDDASLSADEKSRRIASIRQALAPETFHPNQERIVSQTAHGSAGENRAAPDPEQANSNVFRLPF